LEAPPRSSALRGGAPKAARMARFLRFPLRDLAAQLGVGLQPRLENRCAPAGRGNRRHRRGFGGVDAARHLTILRWALCGHAAAASRAAAMWAASRARARAKPIDHDGERQVERLGGFAMGEAGEHDQQQRLAQFERQAAHADRRRTAAATCWAAFRPSRRPRRRRAVARGGDRGE
jgi:hypothetical protein